jgi:hypothetical protein
MDEADRAQQECDNLLAQQVVATVPSQCHACPTRAIAITHCVPIHRPLRSRFAVARVLNSIQLAATLSTRKGNAQPWRLFFVLIVVTTYKNTKIFL